MAQSLLNLAHLYQPLNRNHNAHPTHPSAIPLRSITNSSISSSSSTHISCSLTRQNSHSVNGRRPTNYQPTSWSYNFMQSLQTCNADLVYKDRAQKLEEEVRCMIHNVRAEPLAVLELIDDLERLGLSYRFKEEIKSVLHRFHSLGESILMADKSLYATALRFRLLRQHGYEVSQDVFKEYLVEGEGDPSACIRFNDEKEILSLYEASYLAYEGEEILEKIKALTSKILSKFQENTNPFITHALELPLRRRTHLLEARWYIEAYDQKHDANRELLELAKLNFNMVQSVLQRDLRETARWWKDLELAKNLSFSRDRLMECFFWTVGIIHEPQLASCRKGLTKVASFITVIDDVYDAYGTLEELEQFTDAVERWDINAVRDLPEYMKLCFLALYNTVNEMGYDILKEQGENVIPYLAKAWADLFKAFLQEAKWSHNKTMPSFQDYMENGWRSVSGTAILVHAYFLLGQTLSTQQLDYLINYNQLLSCSSSIFRLCNDLATSSAELARGESVNAISCYMFETGASEEQARQHISKLIDEAWKKLNKECNEQTIFAKPFLEAAINLARISQCTYHEGDSHGAPDAKSQTRVLSLIVQPISIEEQGTDYTISRTPNFTSHSRQLL
ncbi:hypothetical protein K2173_018855 [Erythroxylum novogranatense]|uniref:Uncharacterized protein n=1 Tax=Erythroxylum novogranatense TaxID=1862640 RepID=A0AAV8SAV9_9ROSI|nr:hypothetical protein K2173_018855 [Erythroxylum novogranatense]